MPLCSRSFWLSRRHESCNSADSSSTWDGGLAVKEMFETVELELFSIIFAGLISSPDSRDSSSTWDGGLAAEEGFEVVEPELFSIIFAGLISSPDSSSSSSNRSSARCGDIAEKLDLEGGESRLGSVELEDDNVDDFGRPQISSIVVGSADCFFSSRPRKGKKLWH